MSRTRKGKPATGLETWKAVSKAAGVWQAPIERGTEKKYVKRQTNRHLRRKAVDEGE